MHKKHSPETLTFNAFSGYYGHLSSGYGGFDYSTAFSYMNATLWQNVDTDWCDTGFQNVCHGAGLAVTRINAGLYSSKPTESFSLKSMVAASGWETNQPFTINSYTYIGNGDFLLKASDVVHLSQTAQTVNFAKIGHKGDFRNIAAVTISAGTGSYGNTCSYGYRTTGTNLALDNLKVVWNGKIPPASAGKVSMTPGLLAHAHAHAHHAAQQMMADGNHQSDHENGYANASHSHADAGHHSQLLSLAGDESGGLTNQFRLPVVEHFGL